MQLPVLIEFNLILLKFLRTELNGREKTMTTCAMDEIQN